MSELIANFSFKVGSRDLSVRFQDRSKGDPDKWDWKFGDIISNSQNPNIIFPTPGPYKCTLVVSKGEEISKPYSFDILVTKGGIGVPITQMIQMDTPPEYNINEEYLQLRIKNWQLYLQNSPTPHIADEDVFDETKWPPMYNLLIAKLAIYDYMTLAGKRFLINLGTGDGTTPVTAKGPVKRIETGPSNVEWYDLSTFWDNLSKTIGGEGILQLALDDICAFANQLGVWLPMCPYVDVPHLFSIFYPKLDRFTPIEIFPYYILPFGPTQVIDELIIWEEISEVSK
jgi:hypothetical protein